MDSLIETLALYALPVLFAITLHEAAHGYAARHFGDPTAWQAGRISLNPVRHIDPVGTIVVPVLILIASKLAAGSGILFGWAKPVPVRFDRLRHPKRDMLWVAAAGPAANLFMAFCWALLLKLAVSMPEASYARPLAEMSRAGITVNGVLMLLNLLPIPPLDGGRIAVSLLPDALAWRYAQLERFGLVLLLLLLFAGVLDIVLYPLLGLFMAAIRMLFAF